MKFYFRSLPILLAGTIIVSSLSFADVSETKAREYSGLRVQSSDQGSVNVIAKLGAMIVAHAATAWTASMVGLSVPAHGVMHVAELLYEIGILSRQSDFKNAGVQALLVGVSGFIALNPQVMAWVKSAPLGFGNAMTETAGVGPFYVAVCSYIALNYGWDFLRQNTPLAYVVSGSLFEASEKNAKGEL